MEAVGTGAAFFDLDKTVIAKSATLAFARPLHRAGLLRRRTLLRAAMSQAVYRMTGADQDKLDRLRDHLIGLTKGMKASRIRELVEETIEDVVTPLVYEEALELIKQHRQEGRKVVILSISPEEVVEPLAAHLGVRQVIATRSEIDQDGHYVGELSFYAGGTAKAEAIGRMAEEWGIDLGDCYAYSDGITDLPMLEAVGHPVAVNPDRGLRKIAEERGWPIVRFARPVTLRRRLAAIPKPIPLVSVATTLLVAAITITLWVRRAVAGGRAGSAG
ncbi:MAG: HAD-IB family hydrolase [bacterium]|nr:HAD-IB family hydrolase [bacterium]